MKLLRLLAAAVICVLAAYAVYRVCWLPYQCEILLKRNEAIVQTIFDLPRTIGVVSQARRGISNMNRCLAACPANVDAYMTLAAYERVIEQLPEAADAYAAALRYDRRPEIFFNLGMVQLQMNQHATAVQNFTLACVFNLNYINELPDPSDRALVAERVQAIKTRRSSRALR